MTTTEEKQQIIINCDDTPYIPNNCSIVEHQKCGQLNFDPNEIILYDWFENQKKNGIDIEIENLMKQLDGVLVLNACVLDYLLTHKKYIPKKWMMCANILFIGTIYNRDSEDVFKRGFFVRRLWYGNNSLYKCDFTWNEGTYHIMGVGFDRWCGKIAVLNNKQ